MPHALAVLEQSLKFLLLPFELEQLQVKSRLSTARTKLLRVAARTDHSVIGGRELGWADGPWSFKSRVDSVASTERVSAGQGDNLLVIETHAAKDLTEVIGCLGGIRQETSGWAEGLVVKVGATALPRDLRSSHLLDRYHSGQSP